MEQADRVTTQVDILNKAPVALAYQLAKAIQLLGVEINAGNAVAATQWATVVEKLMSVCRSK